MQPRTVADHLPTKFFLLVFVLATPFWLVGAVAGDLTRIIPINLPLSSLMTVCPLIAASILTYKETGSHGIRKLLRRVFDFERTRQQRWYLPVVFLMPFIMCLSYGAIRLSGLSLPTPQIPLLTIPIFLLVFFVAAIGEEVGWSGYAIDPMQNRWGAGKASIVLGCIWALWHVVPYLQAHRSPAWIVWQCLGAVGSRVLIVWLYNNTGKSVFAATVYHAMSNVSMFLFPTYGSQYNPEVTGIIIIVFSIIILLLWNFADRERKSPIWAR